MALVYRSQPGGELVTFYRMESVAEAVLNALPQAVIQTKLYLMGNDPNGILIYKNTNLFLVSISGSLTSMLKTVALIVIELHRYNCTVSSYCLRLVKFDTFPSLP